MKLNLAFIIFEKYLKRNKQYKIDEMKEKIDDTLLSILFFIASYLYTIIADILWDICLECNAIDNAYLQELIFVIPLLIFIKMGKIYSIILLLFITEFLLLCTVLLMGEEIAHFDNAYLGIAFQILFIALIIQFYYCIKKVLKEYLKYRLLSKDEKAKLVSFSSIFCRIIYFFIPIIICLIIYNIFAILPGDIWNWYYK